MLLCFPEEILLRIFSELPHRDLAQCAAVCQHFQRITGDSTLCMCAANCSLTMNLFAHMCTTLFLYGRQMKKSDGLKWSAEKSPERQ